MLRSLVALVLLAPFATAQQSLFTSDPKLAAWKLVGTSIANLGDVNGDGVADFVIGIPGHASSSGEARVISGADREVIRVLHGQGQNFGTSVCATGDLNGDGVSDLAVGAPNAASSGPMNVRVFSGKTGAVLRTYSTGSINSDEFGFSIANIGDFNGDGFEDLAVGAPGRNNDEGAAYVYSGKTGNLQIVFTGTAFNQRFGHAVAAVGDVNGDGRTDFAVGAPRVHQHPVLYLWAGTVRVYSGLSLSQLYTVFASSPLYAEEGEFGTSVTGLGDFNNDGTVDWAAGGPKHGVDSQHNPENRGFVQVRSGSNASVLQSFISGQDDQYFGAAVAGPGDLNGDGYDDLLVGAPFNAGTGVAAAYRGGPSNTPLFIKPGGSTTHYGAMVAAIGDINSDGYADLAVGAPFDDGFDENGGRLELLSGKTFGVIDEIFPTTDDAFAGAALTMIDDFDGDDVPDYAVGIPGADFDAEDAGAVFIHSGGNGSRLLIMDGSGAAGDEFGASVARLGDVNNDGDQEIAIGSPRANKVTIFPTGIQIDAGKVQIQTLWPPQTIKTVWGAAAGDQFGFSVASGFDVNQDGVTDVIAGAPYSNANGSDSGEVRILSGVNGAKLLTVAGHAPGEQFGWSVDGLGDVDNDGVDDFVAGAPGFSSVLAGGRAYIHSGASGALIHSFAWFGTSRLGESVTGAGDMNGDGVEDVVVGAPDTSVAASYAGGAYAISGATGALIRIHYGTNAFDKFGSSVCGVGDVDNDGASDYAVGAIEVYTFFGDKGSVRVFSGATGTVLQDLAGDAIGHRFGAALAGGEDLDGDRLPDLVVGAPQADPVGTNSGQVEAFSLRPIGLTHYGDGTDGCNGWQIMSGNKSPRVGTADFKLNTTNAPANGLGFLLLGNVPDVAGSDPFGVGALLHVDLLLSTSPVILGIASDQDGVFQLGLPIANNPLLAGFQFSIQTVWSWTGVCSLPPADLGSSNGLRLTILP